MKSPAVGLNTYKVHLDERRRPTLPPALLAEAGIAPGAHEMIAWVDSRGRLVLEDPLALLSSLQDEVADGKARTIEAQDVMAICIQHEMDHLLGKVFVEYLSLLKRDRIKKKMRKAQREDAH